MVDPARVEIPVGQPDRAAGVELDREPAPMGVDGDDGAAVAVVDVEGLVVPQENDAVARGKAALVDRDLVVAEPAAVAHERVSVGVELGNAAALQRDQHRLLLRVAFSCLPPVAQLSAHGGRGVVGHCEASALRFEEDVGVDVTLAQATERADLFGVELAAVADELDGAEAFADRAEGATGLDLRQLARVADADELAAGGGDVCGESLVGAGPDHARFVDQQDGGGRERVAVVEAGEQPGGVYRAYAGLVFERAGGQVAGRRSQNGMTGGGKGLDGDAKRVGLARARARLHVLDPVPRTRQRPHQRPLLGRQGWVRAQRPGDGLARDHGHPCVAALGHCVEQGLLGGQQGSRGVAEIGQWTGDDTKSMTLCAVGGVEELPFVNRVW